MTKHASRSGKPLIEKFGEFSTKINVSCFLGHLVCYLNIDIKCQRGITFNILKEHN